MISHLYYIMLDLVHRSMFTAISADKLELHDCYEFEYPMNFNGPKDASLCSYIVHGIR